MARPREFTDGGASMGGPPGTSPLRVAAPRRTAFLHRLDGFEVVVFPFWEACDAFLASCSAILHARSA